jgi:hypothetical protein
LRVRRARVGVGWIEACHAVEAVRYVAGVKHGMGLVAD